MMDNLAHTFDANPYAAPTAPCGPPTDHGLARVRVCWQGRHEHSARAYAISVDFRTRAYVRDGETIEMLVASGHHTIHTMNGWCGSSVIEFEAEPGETLEFACECGPRVSPLFFPVAMVWSIVFPRQFLSVDLVARRASPFMVPVPLPQ